MTRKPPRSLSEMAREADGGVPMQIAGKPADVCPYCGAAMFAYHSETLTTRVERYVKCRNDNCGKRFVARAPLKPPATIMREVGNDEVSNFGTERLTLVRHSA